MLGFDALGRRALGEITEATASAVAAAVGTFALTFQPVVTQAGMAADAGTLAVVFQDVNSTARLPAEQGTFTLSGQSASFVANHVMPADPFPVRDRGQLGFAALGEVAIGETKSTARPTLALSFQQSVSSVSMPAEFGTFTLTGINTDLFIGSKLTAVTGTYTLAGLDAVFMVNMPADRGTYALTFKTADGVRRIAKIRAFPRVGRGTIASRSMGRDEIKIRAYGG